MKAPIPQSNVCDTVSKLLDTIQHDMFTSARDAYYSRLKEVTKWDDVVPTLDDKCVVVMPWCEVEACEDDIKERSGRSWVFISSKAAFLFTSHLRDLLKI